MNRKVAVEQFSLALASLCMEIIPLNLPPRFRHTCMNATESLAHKISCIFDCLSAEWLRYRKLWFNVNLIARGKSKEEGTRFPWNLKHAFHSWVGGQGPQFRVKEPCFLKYRFVSLPLCWSREMSLEGGFGGRESLFRSFSHEHRGILFECLARSLGAWAIMSWGARQDPSLFFSPTRVLYPFYLSFLYCIANVYNTCSSISVSFFYCVSWYVVSGLTGICMIQFCSYSIYVLERAFIIVSLKDMLL